MSRTVQSWRRSTLKNRFNFKFETAGCSLKRVAASYSSQRCPLCDFVHRRNRDGDSFQCLFCGYDGNSHGVASLNLLDFYYMGLGPYMKKEEVWNFLKKEFRRRFECWDFLFSPSQIDWESVRELKKNSGFLKELSVENISQLSVSGKSPDVASLDVDGSITKELEASTRTAKLMASSVTALDSLDLRE